MPVVPDISSDRSDAVCAAEPIRFPDSVQPHGVLLAVDLADSPAIVAASANAAALLGADPLGLRFDALFGSGFAAAVRHRSGTGDLSPAFPWETAVPHPAQDGTLEAACHVHDGLVLIELEHADTDDGARALMSTRYLQRWIGRLRSSGSTIEALAQVACQGVRQITGYERVLVYRFDPGWHGQAIAEDQVEGWAQSLNGLHFPASDIPSQARELYRHSLMRWVPDRDYAPVPLRRQPGWREGRPIDLSFARLRSLSPTHMQYHRNMGVNGTMSISILRGDELWGLVVCHHRLPHRLSPGQRAAAAALTDAFALRVGPAERQDVDRARRADMQHLSQLIAHMAKQNEVAAAVTGGPVTLDRLFGASGAAAVHAGTVVTTGHTPPPADLLDLAAWLRLRPEQELFQTDRLPDEFPPFAQHAAVASGLLAAFLSSDRADILLWFRPEEAQQVSWGGDPRKQTDGAAHPAPRQSFERWVETQHGHARPWAEWELDIAGTLRHAITEVVIRNLRQVAELNEQLRQSHKMEAVGQLTGGLAHDFNNLLTGITGSLELLNSRLAQGRVKDVERYVSAAQGAAKRAAALTHRLLAFARRQTLDPRPTDMNRLVAGMEELVRRTVGPGITLEVVAAGGLWATLIDPNQLENALLNLCINGRDAMPEGGLLTIETANRWLDPHAAAERDLPPGQYVSLCVSDNGTGMPADVAERAFDPFFTTKPMGHGTGLGLSMIYGFARQSGGQVRIYSEPGQGTMVCMYLPRHLAGLGSPETAEQVPDQPAPGHAATVLVVDDEPTVRMLVAEVLGDLGYTTIEAGDGAAGLRVLQSSARIDLVVTDIGLPGGMNGRQMADAARTTRPELKVLFITGYAENAVLSHGHLDPGMHVMTKPFAIQALAKRIDEMITGGQPRSE